MWAYTLLSNHFYDEITGDIELKLINVTESIIIGRRVLYS